MQDMYIVALVAIGSLTSLGCVALFKGINGKLLTTIVGAVCTISGGVGGIIVGQSI